MFGMFKKGVNNIEVMNMMFDYLYDLKNEFNLNADSLRTAMPKFTEAMRFVCDRDNIKLNESQKAFVASVQRTGIEKTEELVSIFDQMNALLKAAPANFTQIQIAEIQKFRNAFDDICIDRYQAEMRKLRSLGL